MELWAAQTPCAGTDHELPSYSLPNILHMNSGGMMNMLINSTVWGGNKIIDARLMFPHKPQCTAWNKKDFHPLTPSPKKALTNNKATLAIRDNEETEYCRAVKNASHTERKHLAGKDLIYARATTKWTFSFKRVYRRGFGGRELSCSERPCHTCTSKWKRSVRALSAH